MTWRARTHLFGVLEVLEESLLVPSDTLVHVGSGVGEALRLTGLATEDTANAPDMSASTFSPRGDRARRLSTHPCRLGPTLWGSPAPRVWH